MLYAYALGKIGRVNSNGNLGIVTGILGLFWSHVSDFFPQNFFTTHQNIKIILGRDGQEKNIPSAAENPLAVTGPEIDP